MPVCDNTLHVVLKKIQTYREPMRLKLPIIVLAVVALLLGACGVSQKTSNSQAQPHPTDIPSDASLATTAHTSEKTAGAAPTTSPPDTDAQQASASTRPSAPQQPKAVAQVTTRNNAKSVRDNPSTFPATTSKKQEKQQPRKKLDIPQPGPKYTLHVDVEGYTTYIYARRNGDGHVVASEKTRYFPGLFAKYVVLSPDNRTVTYSIAPDPTDRMQVWLVDVDGSNERKILDIPTELWTASPAWSPDSKRIAYVRTASPGKEPGLELWVVNADGSGNRKLLTHPSFNTSVFYNADERPLRWNEYGDIEYRDYARGILYTVNSETGELSQQATQMKPPESAIPVIRTAAPLPIQSQNDPRWRYEKMNSCKLTMGSYACAVTTTSMSFSANGVPTDPQQLSHDLDEFACPLYWAYASDYHSNNKLELWGQWAFDWYSLDLSLSKGRPAMVMLADAFTTEEAMLLHWVLVVGGGGGTPDGYRIYDPFDGTTYKTLAYYTDMGYGLQKIYVYAPKPPKAAKAEKQGDTKQKVKRKGN